MTIKGVFFEERLAGPERVIFAESTGDHQAAITQLIEIADAKLAEQGASPFARGFSREVVGAFHLAMAARGEINQRDIAFLLQTFAAMISSMALSLGGKDKSQVLLPMMLATINRAALAMMADAASRAAADAAAPRQ